MTRKLRVFLCHASQDKPAVRELYNALKFENWIDPWLDKERILPGQDWEMVIEKAVDDSDVVIACISSQSVTKEGFVQREIRYAYDIALEKPEDTIFLIPLRLDNCHVPRKLRTLHWVDYFGFEKEDAYSDLLDALKLRYEQKTKMEADELARRQEKEKAQREADNLARKVVAEKVTDKKAKIEPTEKTVFEKAEIVQREKTQRRRERYVRENAKEYDRREKIEKLIDQIFNWTSVNFRLLGISGVILFVLLFGAFGLNYFLDNSPAAMATIHALTGTPAIKPPTLTTTPLTLSPSPTETLIPISTLDIGSTMISEKDGMVLAYVPAGSFTMGSNTTSEQLDEKPEHQVDLDAFWIDQTEVTNAMYMQCVAADICQPPASEKSYAHDSYYGSLEFANYPVVYVDWNRAKSYCSWAGRRLPTEAEWEKAARGTDGHIYPWGDNRNSDVANVDASFGDTTEVGKFPSGASIYGAFDLAGNVWEWVEDWYGESYYYVSPLSNPLGPQTGTYRILRGGAWNSYGFGSNITFRSSYRFETSQNKSDYSFGFRCAFSE